jgi:hypothetical protein
MPTITVRADVDTVRLAQEALSIQAACNLCGLAQRFAEVMAELLREEASQGTSWVNQHPVTKLWVDKFQHLARLPQFYRHGGEDTRVPDWADAWVACQSLARGEDVQWTVIAD